MKSELIINDEFQEYEVEPTSVGFKNMRDNHIFIFPNGYGASVVKHYGSYGYEQDLFELAVLEKIDDDEYELCYDTSITDDVLGWLENDDVMKTLEDIKNLESKGKK